MEIRNPKAFTDAAGEALDHARDNRKIVALWAGVSLGISLLSSLLNFVLQGQIDTTGGLSGIGLRSILSTLQSILGMGNALFIPFWSLGYTSAVLGFARKQPVTSHTLLNGFRRFGSGFRLMLLKFLLFILLAVFGIYIAAMFLAMTPLAEPVYAVMEANLEAVMSYNIDDALAAEMLTAMAPMLLCCTVISFLIVIPVFYKLRMADYLVMDEPPMGALACALGSRQLMRGNCMSLLRLDLRFWWFYLLSILTTVLCYGDVLLAFLGVQLPISASAAFFAFYIASLLANFAVLYFHGNRVYTAYAAFYDTLRNPETN